MAGALGGGTAVGHCRWRSRQRWGNETIRVHPDEGWLELRLPAPLAALSNTPGRAATYRLSGPVVFTHRAAEWAAQVSGGAVRYDVSLDPTRGKGRWYLDASWRLPARKTPSLEELREHSSLGVDLNADHLAAWVLSPTGNPLGEPTRSRSTSMGSQPQPGMAGCGRRSPSCCGSPRSTAAVR